jgi:hypothetical protein
VITPREATSPRPGADNIATSLRVRRHHAAESAVEPIGPRGSIAALRPPASVLASSADVGLVLARFSSRIGGGFDPDLEEGMERRHLDRFIDGFRDHGRSPLEGTDVAQATGNAPQGLVQRSLKLLAR